MKEAYFPNNGGVERVMKKESDLMGLVPGLPLNIAFSLSFASSLVQLGRLYKVIWEALSSSMTL